MRARLPGRSRAVAQLDDDLLGIRCEAPHGHLVVNASVVPAVTQVFKHFVRGAFPDPHHDPDLRIWRERPGINGRRQHRRLQLPVRSRERAAAVVGARIRRGIDVNTVENPYVFNGQVLPANAAAYKVRRHIARAWRCPAASSSMRSRRWLAMGRPLVSPRLPALLVDRRLTVSSRRRAATLGVRRSSIERRGRMRYLTYNRRETSCTAREIPSNATATTPSSQK